VVTLVFLGIYVLSKLSNIGMGIASSSSISIPGEFIEMVFTLLIVGYQLWVVYAFMDELQTEGRRGGGTAEVHYTPPKNTTGENPPAYNQGGAGYTSYAPVGSNPHVMYPKMPTDENQPYKGTTANY